MKFAPAVIGVTSVLALLTWLLLNGLNFNSVRYDRQLQALADFTRFERGMTREVLTARAGLSRNYDKLVQLTDAYDDALTRLRETPGLNAEETRAIDVLSARARRQEDLIERFKSRNALLQNSFAYFGLFSDKLAESDQRSLVTAASALAAGMLRLTLDTSDVVARQVQDRLEELALAQTPPQDMDSVRALLMHGQMLHDLLPDIDLILKALVAEFEQPRAGRRIGIDHQASARLAGFGAPGTPVAVHYVAAAALRRRLFRIAIAPAGDRAAPPCGVRARHGRHLDAVHQFQSREDHR